MKLTHDQHKKLALAFCFDTFSAQMFDEVFPDGSGDDSVDEEDLAAFTELATRVTLTVEWDVVDGEVVSDDE